VLSVGIFSSYVSCYVARVGIPDCCIIYCIIRINADKQNTDKHSSGPCCVQTCRLLAHGCTLQLPVVAMVTRNKLMLDAVISILLTCGLWLTLEAMQIAAVACIMYNVFYRL